MNYIMPVMDNLYFVDNKMGYRFGQLMWLSFYIPSLVVLFCDSTTGPSRDFLLSVSLLSCASLLYYTVHRWLDTPASTPGMHTQTCELYARWLLAAYFGPANVIGSHAVGVMNWVQLVLMGVFGLAKLPASIYTLFDYEGYKAYEQKHRENVY